MSTRTMPPIPAPTADQVRHDLAWWPEVADAAVLLLEQGINTYEIPMDPDAFTADGYLAVTGQIIDDRIETTRRPWPNPRLWDAITPNLPAVQRYLRGETP